MATNGEAERTERIRARAFSLWEQEGRPLGRSHEHWETAALQIAREEGSHNNEGEGDHPQPLLSEPRTEGAGVDASRTGRTADPAEAGKRHH